LRLLHWDLMLEADEALRTWALEREPKPGVWIGAERLPDHRKAYLEYEGPVSGERGRVTKWDAGQYWREKESPCELVVKLSGGRLQGLATLVRSSEEDQRWRVRFSGDRAAPVGPAPTTGAGSV
jgi:hypothetical protein